MKKIAEILYKIAICWVIGIVLFVVQTVIASFFTGSYADGSYDRCMEECVLPDKSNYDKCSLDTCDFPV